MSTTTHEHRRALLIALALLGGLLCLAGLLGAQGDALASTPDAPPDHRTSVSDYSARECKALFGSTRRREANVLYREKHLNRVMGASGRYTIIHHNPRWEKPVQLRVRGLRLVELVRDRGETPYLRVELDLPTAVQLSCRPGVYRLTTDDNLAPGASILAILDRSLLVARNGRLVYVSATPGLSPDFRMIWQSRWTLEVQSESRGVSSGVAPKRSSKSPPPRSRARRR